MHNANLHSCAEFKNLVADVEPFISTGQNWASGPQNRQHLSWRLPHVSERRHTERQGPHSSFESESYGSHNSDLKPTSPKDVCEDQTVALFSKTGVVNCSPGVSTSSEFGVLITEQINIPAARHRGIQVRVSQLTRPIPATYSQLSPSGVRREMNG